MQVVVDIPGVAMFVRAKKSGRYEYLQVIHNERVAGKVAQRVIATLGRLDVLRTTGQLDAFLASCSRFTEHVAIIDAHRRGTLSDAETVRVGPVLAFERLWRELGIPQVIDEMLKNRRFEFSVERALFITVLHRLFDPGSDRAAEVWKGRYAIEGAEAVDLHHLYRTMGWLGEELPQDQQAWATPFSPRCTKDVLEESIFARRKDLFTGLDLVFFDTTSLCFEGRGGQAIGQHGHSKDHRPDLYQMVVGVVLDQDGRPVCCELWPGNTTDIRTLVPVVDRLKHRFHIGRICVVADRGMFSAPAMAALQEAHRDVRFILGGRMRRTREIDREVLGRAGRFRVVRDERQASKDPAPLEIKEVWVEDRRYIVCFNPEQARKDAADREAIVDSLEDQLQRGARSLIGNKGYRKYLRLSGSDFVIDAAKVKADARYDGMWVLRTDTDLSSEDVALRYKELWMVEAAFRSVKSVLRTRPIYHKCDETIRGHVFCGFLALVLLKELLGRMKARGWETEWARLRDDLDALQDITVRAGGKSITVRSRATGDAGKALQAIGVALGPTVRAFNKEERTDSTK